MFFCCWCYITLSKKLYLTFALNQIHYIYDKQRQNLNFSLTLPKVLYCLKRKHNVSVKTGSDGYIPPGPL